MFAWLTAVVSHLLAGRGKEPRRSSSYFERDQRDEGENQRLLPHDVEAEEFDHHDGCFPPHAPNQTSPYADLPVYTTIHRYRITRVQDLIRRDVIAAIDDPYSIEQLRDPRMNLSVFQREQASHAHHQSVRATRALFCELLANRILRRFLEDNPGAQGLLLLSQILVGGFDPFQNAPPEVMEHLDQLSWTVQSRTGKRRKLPALEIAIISESKLFLSSSACQKVVDAIYEGRVIYTPTSFINILPDHYKHKPVSLYNPRRAPLFNQYRLIVPRTRKFIEVCEFMLLLVLFLFVMADRDPSHFSSLELIFQVYTVGFLLDMFATVLEHGWHVYTQNLWSFLDVTFAGIFTIYLCLRAHGWRVDDPKYGQQAMDVLAMGAPVLVPRLAFNLMSENMLFVSLRAMMRDFTVLTVLAVWCFAGFLLSMSWLSDGEHKPITISKWMLWVWFGLDGTGIQKSTDFHWLLGPILMVAFAFLGNTLFLTILVSMLSTTFSNIVSNATAEIQFRRSVLTLEGVKSDAIFAYPPPFNILALLILLPMKFVFTPRWFHKVNVAAVRILNAPILLIIGIIERRILWSGARRPLEAQEQLPKTPSRAGLWDFSRSFSVHGDIQAVFDSEPPEEVEDEIAEDDDFGGQALEDQFVREFGPEAAGGGRKNKRVEDRNRRDSVQPFAGLSQHLKDLINEGSEDGGEDVKSRLEALEQSTIRIERMLGRLCEKLDEGDQGGGSVGR
ncbi:Calcium channel YVC1 [Lachnellula cervina]|uniref:Calcium channel YVC1 n=1 Tax=Lachnellula cervina TaxID=1316786 RepID=A0A7D8YUT2_9HELO|nr:Calcium channel YVC1 [Lachnellula cervina]